VWSRSIIVYQLHEVLARLVYERGGISPNEVDVRFDPPRREWVGALTRPTLDFFLYDVRENVDLRHADLHANRRNGSTSFKLPARRFDLRYMVSAITSQVADEHLLLWRTLALLLRYSTFPVELLTPELRTLEPQVSAQVQRPETDSQFTDLWSGLEVHPRPALMYVVTAPIDLDVVIEAPLVLTRTAHYMAKHDRTQRFDSTVHIGGVLRDAARRPVVGARVGIEGRSSAPTTTDAEGRFVLVGVPQGKLDVRVTRDDGPSQVLSVTVPSDEYELVIP